MTHHFTLAILPEGYVKDLRKKQSKVEKFIDWLMDRYDMGGISGNYHDNAFYDYYRIGGNFDGAINGLLRIVWERHLGRGERVASDEAARRFAEETTMERNSCLVWKIEFLAEDPGTMKPDRVVLPDGTVKEMLETPEATAKDWEKAWTEVVGKYGDCIGIGLDCHL